MVALLSCCCARAALLKAQGYCSLLHHHRTTTTTGPAFDADRGRRYTAAHERRRQGAGMSAEAIAIVAVGVTLLAVLVPLMRALTNGVRSAICTCAASTAT